ncbi:MAG: hypothetical protein EAZ95_11175, partial [Bacteroidetes bacterium]
MAKKQNKERNYSEAELVKMFGLTRINDSYTPLMVEWLDCETTLTTHEQVLFDEIYSNAHKNIAGWQEEDLKMQFIAFVLHLGYLRNTDEYHTYFEKTISATIEGTFLKTKTDFMVAKGILDLPETPYFHFQEWKPLKNPTGDSMAQLLEAFLIAQETNKNGKPLYGCEIIGKQWNFVTMEGKAYCISQSYNCTKRDELLQIIAILRKFKEILETRLLD